MASAAGGGGGRRSYGEGDPVAQAANKARGQQKKAFSIRVEDIPSVNSPGAGLALSFARSSGPGGQNVNKVNTKCILTLEIKSASWIPEWVRTVLVHTQRNRISSPGSGSGGRGGVLSIQAQRFRSQQQNIADAMARLTDMINEAGEIDKETSPEKKQRVARLKKIEKEKRMKDKRMASQKKFDRRGGRRRDE
eukprot:Nk52_evm3s2391 gene=Nk52_evmTU3s2391